MSAPQQDGDGGNPLPTLAALGIGNVDAAQRRLALATAARANATREEIEARGIRPNVSQILQHMSRTPSHSFKRARLDHSKVHKVYDDDNDDDDDYDEEGEDDDAFEQQWQALLAEEGLQDADPFITAEFYQVARRRIRTLQQGVTQWRAATTRPARTHRKDRFNLIASLCTCTELAVEVCKHVQPPDIVRLYIASRDFRRTIDKHMRSSIFAWANHMAPTSARIYSSPVYWRWFIADPGERLVTSVDREISQAQPGHAKLSGEPLVNDEEGEIRRIPGLLWLQMVVNREIRVRDIIASLARRGHRLPEGAHLTLKKIWLIMDAATTEARLMLLNNPEFFSNEDLYIAQLFLVKLVLAFNDPAFGPRSSMLMRLMMGQRGLSPLWALLRGKKYRSPHEIRELKLRYDVGVDHLRAHYQGNVPPLYGIQLHELGVLHFEGWGTGPDHLMRPDELIPLEGARRQLDFDKCVEEMMIFGHVDFATGNSLVPSLDEMYMSDDELGPAHKGWKPLKHELIHSGCGNVPFERGMWLPKHARKARWKTLSEEEKAMILEAEQEEIHELREMDGAEMRFQAAWTKLATMTSQVMSTKKLTSEFKLLAPTVDDLQDQLSQFDRPRRPRYTSRAFNADDMDVDDSPFSTPAALRTTLTLPLRPHHRPPPLNPDDPSTIPDDELILEPIPPAEIRRIMASLCPPQHPHDESEAMSSSPEHPPTDDQAAQHDNNPSQPPHAPSHPYHLNSSAHRNPPPEADEEAEDYESTDDDADSDFDNSSDEAPLPNPPIYTPNAAALALLAPFCDTPATTAANTDDMLLAQADLAYSDVDEYEDEEGGDRSYDEDRGGSGVEGGGLQQQQQQQQQGGGPNGDGGAAGGRGGEDPGMGVDGDGDVEMAVTGTTAGASAGNQEAVPVTIAGAGFFDIDWDHFLTNPEAYTVEGEGDEDGEDDEELYVGEEDAEGAEEMLPDDGNADVMQEDEHAGDEHADIEDDEVEVVGDVDDEGEGEDVNVNMLVDDLQGDLPGELSDADDEQEDGGHHVGQLNGFGGSGDVEEEFDPEDYMADEDVGEDKRTKKLRDWYRPW